MNFELAPETYLTLPIFGGFTIDESMIISAIVMGILILFALVVRVFFIPKFKEKPGTFQNLIEMIVSGMGSLARVNLGNKLGITLAPYMTTIGLYILLGGLIELFGPRTPCADLNVTGALAIMTLFLINIFAFREGGIRNAARHFKPVLLAPIMFITDIAAPISLACRLYGNMLAGFVVMELIYSAIPLVVPAALSIYFNIFHSILQAYIFITLSMAFIHERVE